MSSRTLDLPPARSGTLLKVWSLASTVRTGLVNVVHSLAFWGAVLLPIPVLGTLFGGITDGQAPLLALLIALNVVCLVTGHEHTPRNP